MELLRFSTAGSVDDGKSTLIGRLLYDSKSIFQDQLDALEAYSNQKGYGVVDLALLTDGLRAEREQGITIDVAYRYFATPKRKFIIADTPGHIQYTRNMVTGSSNSNLSLILIDACNGIVEQTNRHSFIASLLNIAHLVVCVNKMDLIGYDENKFNEIVDGYKVLASKLDIKDVTFIPISALNGDNVVDRSTNMPWYNGPTLMYLLEHVHLSSDINHIDGRFPVQYVIRPKEDKYHDYRGYAGRVASGIFRVDDKVMVLPSGFTSTIKSIDSYDKTLEECFAPQSVTIVLNDDIDISRGDMIVRENNVPQSSQDLEMMMCWFSDTPMQPNGRYILRHTTKESKCVIKDIRYRIDVNTYHRNEEEKQIKMNDICRVHVRTQVPIFFDSYRKNRITGSVILIDEATNNTVAAGMIM